MVFRTYSLLEYGVPMSDAAFSSKDTYVTVVSTYHNAVGASVQATGEKAIKRLFNIIYEGPVAFNHFHHERKSPSQKIIVFEKKPTSEVQCQPEQKSVPAVQLMGKIPAETI